MLNDKGSLFLLLLSESSKLESRNQEVHQEVGVDTEIAGSSLLLSIYLEDTRKNTAFSDKSANKFAQYAPIMSSMGTWLT